MLRYCAQVRNRYCEPESVLVTYIACPVEPGLNVDVQVLQQVLHTQSSLLMLPWLSRLASERLTALETLLFNIRCVLHNITRMIRYLIQMLEALLVSLRWFSERQSRDVCLLVRAHPR